MTDERSTRLLFLVVAVSFLSVVVTIVQVFGLAGLLGVVLAMALSAGIILALRLR